MTMHGLLIVIVQVFSREVGVNKWKIVCATCWKTNNLSVCTVLFKWWCGVSIHVIQVKEHFENSGYTAHGEPVDVQVTSDDETSAVQNVTTGWRIEKLHQVYIAITFDCIIIPIFIRVQCTGGWRERFPPKFSSFHPKIANKLLVPAADHISGGTNA